MGVDLKSAARRVGVPQYRLKDIEEGLVDFPSEREGRTVYLCWKLGEDVIGYWHELDTGFPGRQPGLHTDPSGAAPTILVGASPLNLGVICNTRTDVSSTTCRVTRPRSRNR